jgi:hypothetical protein
LVQNSHFKHIFHKKFQNFFSLFGQFFVVIGRFFSQKTSGHPEAADKKMTKKLGYYCFRIAAVS